MLFIWIVPAISLLIYLIFVFLKFKNLLSKEKLSPFECGYDPFSLSRVPFSLKFFYWYCLFSFWCWNYYYSPFSYSFLNKSISLFISFMMINMLIVIGLFFEWKSGMIDWMK